MKRFITSAVFAVLSLLISVPSFSCTSVIISGMKTESGRPIMLKHRDTDDLDNSVKYFTGQKYSFIALVNANRIESHVISLDELSQDVREAWSGTNEAGFCIMNTASYNLKDDKVPDSKMDKEGIIMFKALGICATTSDFEAFLDTLPKPWGVEANFGIIDARGGAAYYEVNNHSWKKYDVNDTTVSPGGYRVVTNFSESGRKKDYKGYERYLTASKIFSEILGDDRSLKTDISHFQIFNAVSRSYRNEMLGMDFGRDFKKLSRMDGFKGVAVDQDFIPRRITSASIVFEGVKFGENPLWTVMWTILGYPACSVAIPLLVGHQDILPDYVKPYDASGKSEICDLALNIKDNNIFRFSLSNGTHYFDLKTALDCISLCNTVESSINDSFGSLFGMWTSGEISDDDFFHDYLMQTDSYYQSYLSVFSSYTNKTVR